MMTFETPELFGTNRLADSAVSHLSDNVVLLSYVKDTTAIGRAMTVIKSRASHHQPDVRRYRIGSDGIVLTDSAS